MYFYSYFIYFLVWPFIFHFILRPIIKKSGTNKRQDDLPQGQNQIDGKTLQNEQNEDVQNEEKEGEDKKKI